MQGTSSSKSQFRLFNRDSWLCHMARAERSAAGPEAGFHHGGEDSVLAQSAEHMGPHATLYAPYVVGDDAGARREKRLSSLEIREVLRRHTVQQKQVGSHAALRQPG
jgi:hypothetical protein